MVPDQLETVGLPPCRSNLGKQEYSTTMIPVRTNNTDSPRQSYISPTWLRNECD